jgi:hypothetical protein
MKKLIIIVSTILLLFSSTSFAGGFYLGAGIGNTFFSSEFILDEAVDEAQEISENSTAWKIFGGIPLNEFLHIEGGYRNFGNINADIQDEMEDVYQIENKIFGFDVEAMGRFKISMIDLFAKAGVMFWTSELSYQGVSLGEETGTDFLWGLGAGINLGGIAVRAEWESLALESPDNIGMVSLSATFGF